MDKTAGSVDWLGYSRPVASIRVRNRKGHPPSYCVRWRDPDLGGKECSYTFESEQEAEQFAFILTSNKGRLAPTAEIWGSLHDTTPSVEAVLAQHIEQVPSVTARTRADYRRDAANHITPHIGAIPVGRLTQAHVHQWLQTLSESELSDKTIANVHGLLSSAVRTAVRQGHRPDNPCEGVRLPRRNHGEDMVFLTPGQWSVLDQELAKPCDGYYRILFRTLAWTGMRWGEVCALQVGDLAFTTKPPTVRIVRALKRDENSQPYVGPTKTRRSKRVISIPETLAVELKEHVRGRGPEELVFRSHTGSTLHHSNIRIRAWLPAVKAAMDPEHGDDRLLEHPRIHDLRHSHASWLFSQGLDLLAVQRRLGHESITTTADRYGHMLPGQQLAAAAAMDELFG